MATGVLVPAGGGREELSILQGQAADIAIYRPPEIVLDEARKAAVALQAVIAGKKDPVMMNGQQYLEYEDWQTVGRFYNVTAKVEKTEFVQYGNVRGFSASAVAIRSDGMEVSRAEADCLSDEPKWSKKAKYEWRDKPDGSGRERLVVGEEDVPLFQLKSMAQTRACAKALRNVLAWVVVLAGYRPTPAEELEREQGSEPKPAGLRKKGSNARGPWVLFTVNFEDGRSGKTFSKTDGEHAERAEKAGALVRPRLVKGEKGVDLEGFDPLKPEAPKTEEHPKPEHDEPINGAEKILTIRKPAVEGGTHWFIQTSKRIVKTENGQPEARLRGLVATAMSAAGVPFSSICPDDKKEGA